MPASTYPFRPQDCVTCPRCESQVYHAYLCDKHGVCVTCENKAGEMCERPVSRAEALLIARQTIEQAEEEREAERIAVARIVESLYGP